MYHTWVPLVITLNTVFGFVDLIINCPLSFRDEYFCKLQVRLSYDDEVELITFLFCLIFSAMVCSGHETSVFIDYFSQ